MPVIRGRRTRAVKELPPLAGQAKTCRDGPDHGKWLP
jgi:hypothetical protein